MSIVADYRALNQRLREFTGPSWYPQVKLAQDVDFLTRLSTLIGSHQYYSWKPIFDRARALLDVG